MGALRQIDPSLLVVACFSRHVEALDWSVQRLIAKYGPVALISPDFDFHHTKYYEPTMGPSLRKRFVAFESLVAPETLPSIKLATNGFEEEAAGSGRFTEARPLNLDPGLLQLGKFLLATTKDQSHRIYLYDGIYAEVTLRFHDGAWLPWPWTYADYREPPLHAFLLTARDFYRHALDKVKLLG